MSTEPENPAPGTQHRAPSTALIVFDLDGTLIDSRLDIAESANEVVESYGGAALPIDRVSTMIGEGAQILVERALEAGGLDPAEPEALARFKRIYDRRLLLHTKPYEGIPDALARLTTRATLAVLTNKPEAPTYRLLHVFELDRRFAWVVGGDGAHPRKPDPAGLRYLIETAGSSAERTLYVGDSMIDVETARRAGVDLLVAKYGFGELRGELQLRADEPTVDDSRMLGEKIEAWLSTRL
ncbi:MAG TPA: HAD-IA family hydrolase [Vicinamibacterales bacterium]|nr:HAD-IA family hydrolase [Vicinamibacterales bacterium]